MSLAACLGRLARWRSWALPLAWAIGACAVASAGFLEDPYLRHVRRMEPPFAYPLRLVADLAALMALHAGVLQAILRPASYRMSWGRAAVAWLPAIGLLFVIAMASIHAPPPLMACLWWLLAVAAAMTGLLIVSATLAWARRSKDPPAGSSSC